VRTAATLLLAALCCAVAGCGDVARNDSDQAEAATECPPQIEPVEAADVIGHPPRGFEVTASDEKAIAEAIKPIRDALGDHLRAVDSRVLVRKGRMNGTAVIVLNADQQIGLGDDLIVGAEEGAREAGREIRQVSIAGADGRLLRAPDGAWYTLSGYGECSVLILIADNERPVRQTVEQLPRRPDGA
jgi:hypothetical protein